MRELSLLTDYLNHSNSVTIAVLVWLSLYFILINWVFFYRYIYLIRWLFREKNGLENLKIGSKQPYLNSFLNFCAQESDFNKEIGEYCIFDATTKATKGLTLLSIVASTSPFIGLFGTVVSILETFYILGERKVGISAISSSIGEALVATAAGILVAIFAYSYHLILKRKSFELISYIKMQIDILLQYR